MTTRRVTTILLVILTLMLIYGLLFIFVGFNSTESGAYSS